MTVLIVLLTFILSFPLAFLILGLFGLIIQAWPLFLGLGLAAMFLNYMRHKGAVDNRT